MQKMGSVKVSKEKQTSSLALVFSHRQFLHGVMRQADGDVVSFAKD